MATRPTGKRPDIQAKRKDIPPLKFLTKEPHPDYVYTAFLKALDKHGLSLRRSVFYVVQAAIQDMRLRAQFESEPAKTAIVNFLNTYEDEFFDKSGGGGGDEQGADILQGP